MTEQTLRQAAETDFADQLTRLAADDGPRPTGWHLTPRAVRRFITGDPSLDIAPKFVGDDALVDRCIVSLMGRQGLMLVGEPGTAKSLLSELLAAAISGRSTNVVQGSAGIIEDHLRYGWNYALLLAEGPSPRAMVPSPVLQAMQAGQIVRVEELTRCAPEVQDVLISLMSEKTITVPELGSDVEYRARPGFNVIATANLRDRGVHDMSSALKRRFNFETVHPIADAAFERDLVARQVAERMADHPGAPAADTDVLDLLVTVFRDLRRGRLEDGTTVAAPRAVMSTAESVNVAHAALLDATYLDQGAVAGRHLARQLQGVVFKDDPEDARKFRSYIDIVARDRAGKSAVWRDFFKAAQAALGPQDPAK
ncbi:AAA family ATPase [Jannaschia pohangensis]|uniref:MoxR-like ATPase n=1 Tax=Jannaschia pohangensis TaxID=390807 RepID=A0A1I3T8G4_9RHOB|nr:AAA family ATPase [Jannaschia pohangensis]SFJ67235.1 MoxR-like ATPase [Jannaschia pohangensis]